MAEDTRLLDYLKRVTAELHQTRQQLGDAEARAREPIAVLGAACRLPGGVASPEDLWELVASGSDAIGPFPTDRGWDLDALAGGGPGGSAALEGGFLRDVGAFDAGFFGVSPREARAMDPQQRIVLELAWEAVERARIAPDSLAGGRVGVFVGTGGQDYYEGLSQANAAQTVGEYLSTGNAASVLSGRIAYALGLEGPAVSVDTACSSSLVALHLAVRALRGGECDLALAGGVTVMTTPAPFVAFSRQGGLAGDGRCKSFADGADGTGWSEGAGLLLVARLSDARRLGHPVLAVVRGSAVNSDGASNGLTAPNGLSQERVLRAALADAGLEPSDVDVVEGHGTGTVLGDPIEAQALLAAYGRDRATPLLLGSVKSNIGHAQAAAGASGVIKIVEALRRGVVPPTLHARTPSTHVDWSAGAVSLVAETTPWPEAGRPRRAGVSSFGVSGTNAHIVFEQAPSSPAVEPVEHSGTVRRVPWVLSARDEAGLRLQAARLAARLDGSPADLALSLATTRAALEHRAAVLVEDTESGRRALAALAEGGAGVRGVAKEGRTAFVFPGQGAQRRGMGLDLAAAHPVFAASFDAVCAELDRGRERPLREVIAEGGPELDRTDNAQAALFAVGVATARLLESWGVRPDLVAGHSVGEVAAAHVAGALSLADACALVAARGAALAALAPGGAMAAVAASPAEVAPVLSARVSLAAVNGPDAVVLSGDAEAVRAAVAEVGARSKELPVSHAFHSALVDPALPGLRDALGSLRAEEPGVAVVSTLTGARVGGAELGSAEHWVRQARGTVRFADAVAALADAGVVRFVEVGPAAGLAAAVTATAPGAAAVPGGDPLAALAALHVSGASVDWVAVLPGARVVDLPTTAFRRDHHWLPAAPATVSAPGVTATGHPLLSAAVTFADSSGALLTGALSVRDQPWLGEHRVAGEAVLPGTALVEIAVRAGALVGCPHVADLVLRASLPVPALVQVAVGGPGDSGRRTVTVHARPSDDEPWTQCATGTLAPSGPVLDPGAGWTGERLAVAGLRERMAAAGLEHGPAFHGLTAAWRDGADVLAEVVLPVQEAGFALHPALLDAATHALWLTGDERPRLPFAWTDVRVLASGARALRVRLTPVGGDAFAVRAEDPSGQPVLSVGSVAFRPVVSRPEPLRRVVWRELPASALAHNDSAVSVWEGSTAVEALAAVRGWLERADGTLVVLNAPAAVRGLVRSAQAEHPGRFVLLDTDSSDLDGAVGRAVSSGEPQVAVRGERLLVPVVEEAPVDGEAPDLAGGLAVVVGAAGALGSLVARHLVLAHGVRDLLLIGRTRSDALVEDLAALGASAEFASCDVADAAALRAVLAGREVATVVHAAGVLDDAPVTALTPERVEAVLRPKVDGVRALRAALADAPLRAVVLFSSVSGVFGAPGQAAYAAANAAVDALAEEWCAAGAPVRSVAWGLWDLESGMAGGLDAAGRARVARTGVRPMPPAVGLALFDAALASPDAQVIAAALDHAALAAQTRVRVAPAAHDIAALVPAALAGSGVGAGFVAADEGLGDLLHLVRAQAAAALGHAGPAEVDPDREFQALGVDSLTAIEVRNGLAAVTGLPLSATLVFDHPTARDLAAHLEERLGGVAEAPASRAAASAGDPVAIVGMACRYPGGVASPEDLWRLVADGVDATGEFPADRGWDVPHDPSGARAGSTSTTRGGFLYDAGEFDAPFFGIPPAEAALVDPQQRLVLEVCWEAAERAGVDPKSLRGSATGVFTGVQYHDYTGAASTGSIISGRVAYTLGLTGPALSVDTACSSSLVALHLAAKALRSGECDLALAGGVTVMATPETFVEFTRQGGLAPDGRCKPFSADADGTAWAEGAGVLLLERLSDARRNGHPVLAVLRGSAVNQDGASNGLTAPNGPAQQRVIRAALADAGLDVSDVDLVEAHGTGTALGDPIEAQALQATYGGSGRPVGVGSVKSNLGHTQAAAGVAGVIKAVQAMRAGVLPRTLHADKPTPVVDWSAGTVKLLTGSAPWPDLDRPRRAAVSSFGVSGTNAHVVLEAGVPVEAPERPERTPRALPWVLSGRGPAALRAQADRLLELVDEEVDLDLGDLARSLATTRSAFPDRAVVFGDRRADLLRGLLALVDGEPDPALVTGEAGAGGRTAFVFAGQGAQRLGMGKGLCARFPVFAETFDAACAALEAEGVAVRAGLDDPDAVDRTDIAQAGLFAFQVATHRLVRSWGIEPDALVGHSIGEVAAAHAAGVLSLSDAARLVAARGRLMAALPEGGAMAAVSAPEAVVAELLVGQAVVAAVNGPSSTVVSGPRSDVDETAAAAGRKGLRAKALRVSHAFHSPLVEPVLAEFAEVAASLTYSQPTIPVVTTAPGPRAALDDPGHWVDQVRDPVRFADAVAGLVGLGCTRFVELGPDGSLTAAVRACADEPVLAAALGSRDGDEAVAAIAGLSALHVAGLSPDWDAFFARGGDRVVELPTYPFQRTRHWYVDTAPAAAAEPGHPLFGAATHVADTGALVLTARLTAAAHPLLADHEVAGSVLVPGAAVAEAALHAGEQAGCPHLADLTLERPLAVPPSGALTIQLALAPPGADGARALTLHSRPEGAQDWTRHATGLLTPALRAPVPDLAEWPPAGATALPVAGAYDTLAADGVRYGPAFQGLRAAWRTADGAVHAEVALPAAVAGEADRFALHPALLDAALHVTAVAGLDRGLPFAWSGVDLHAVGAAALRVTLRPTGAGVLALTAHDPAGRPVLSAGSLVLRTPSAAAPAAAGPESLLRIGWRAIAEAPAVAGRVAVVGPDRQGLADALGAGVVPSVDCDADVVVLALGGGVMAAVEAVRAIVARDEGVLAVVTTRGVAVGAEAADPAAAAVAGLVRSAQAEHPDRVLHVDLDDDPASVRALPAALGCGEPQVAVRAGAVSVPRLTRAAAGEHPVRLGEGPVLLTGATGALGRVLARHLVKEHGVRRLVLAARRADSPSGVELAEELRSFGVEVDLVACDVADRAAVADLLGAHPVTAVVHAAGVLDDGLVTGLTAERVAAVAAPKSGAAAHLDELTRDRELTAFVLFSSAAGVLGAPGQGAYASANAALDAIAARRRAEGLPGTSLAWGLWDTDDGMGGGASAADAARVARTGLRPLPVAEGLALFDAALGLPDALLVPLGVDQDALAAAGPENAPAVLRALAGGEARGRAAGAAPDRGEAERLAALRPHERRTRVLSLVCAETAGVLGLGGPEEVDPDREFTNAGFDSLAAVGLRNRLTLVCGVRLPSTLVFDHPTPRALAAWLLSELVPTAQAAEPEPAADDGLAEALRALTPETVRAAGLAEALLALARDTGAPDEPGGAAEDISAIDDLDTDALISMALDRVDAGPEDDREV